MDFFFLNRPLFTNDKELSQLLREGEGVLSPLGPIKNYAHTLPI